MSDDLEVVKLAIAAAGPATNQQAWNLKVAELVPQIAMMLRPPAPGKEDDATTPLVTARKLREASVFAAEYVKCSEEEMGNTHRLLVAFRSKTTDDKELDGDGLEWLRTEPSWTNAGYIMQRKIKGLEPGTPVAAFKSVESIPGNKKVRVLVHIEVTGRPKNAPQGDVAGSATARPSSAASGAGRNPSPAGTTPTEAHENPAIVEPFKKLTTAQQIAYMRSCRGRQIAEPMNPGPEDIDAALVLLGKIERHEAVT